MRHFSKTSSVVEPDVTLDSLTIYMVKNEDVKIPDLSFSFAA